jgi:serine/threonine-protein kinase
MAPEHCAAKGRDPRSDVWSLGVVLYEMASGHRPFSRRNRRRHDLVDPSRSAPPLPAHVGSGLGAIFEQCLQKEPARRYSDGAQVRAALAAVRSTSHAVAIESMRPTGRRRIVVMAAVAALAAAVGAAVFATISWRDSLRPSSTGEIRSLAVLPLANLSGDAAQDYLADGFTEELIARLSKLPNLS